MITIEKIRAKLQEGIKRSGITQSQLARASGVKQQQISCYLKGNKMPALDTFANLCVVLDLDANDILCVDKYNAD